MADFYPITADVRKRIEKWLKEHVDEVGSSDDASCVVVNEGSGFTASLLEKFVPRRLSPTASAALAAKQSAHAREQLVPREWLPDVVVRAAVQLCKIRRRRQHNRHCREKSCE